MKSNLLLIALFFTLFANAQSDTWGGSGKLTWPNTMPFNVIFDRGGTNTATFNNTNALVGGETLARFQQQGTNRARFLPNGNFILNDTTGLSDTYDYSLSSLRAINYGDPDRSGFIFQLKNVQAVYDYSNAILDIRTNRVHFVMDSEDSVNGAFWDMDVTPTKLSMEGFVFGEQRVLLFPSADPTATSYLYDTSTNHTAGNLVEVRNDGTLVGSVDFAGTASAIHFDGLGSTPTIVTNSGAGTSGATASIVGTDVAGEITINSGLTPALGAAAVTITYSTAYTGDSYVILWPSSATAATLGFLPWVDGSTTGFTVNNGAALGLAGSTTYKYNYHVMQ